MKATLMVGVVALVATGACDIRPGSAPMEASGDRDDWAVHVQPYVATRCGTLDCHGDPGRPFRIYSEEGLRMVEDRELSLTDEEIDDNVAAALGVGPFASVDDHPLLLEPLDPDAGGWHHEGDPVWGSRDDPGYLCISAWLSGADPSTSCEAAAAAVPRGATMP